MWDFDEDSEPEVDIQYKDDDQRSITPDSSDSENAPLISHMSVPGSFTPSKLQITFGDQTSTVTYNKKNMVTKTIDVNQTLQLEDH